MSVSAVIPTYNRISTIATAIESVLDQTVPVTELIVVDDGSSDGSESFIKKRFGNRVDYLRMSENKGVSAARNYGLSQTRSEWIAFLDSDDSWVPEKLEWQLDSLGEELWNHGNELWLRDGKELKQLAKHRKQGGDVFVRSLELCLVSPSTVMVHKDLFEEVGLFDESLPVCEDYDLWLRFFVSHPIGFCENVLTVKTGGHEDQLSRKFFAMDYWRIISLEGLLGLSLTDIQRAAVLKVIETKALILLRGYQKHRNFENYKEVFARYQRAVRAFWQLKAQSK